MKYLIGLFILILSQSLFAGVHTCVVNGKTVYQGKPCAGKELNSQVMESQARIKG